jgi:acetyl esterase/lipase
MRMRESLTLLRHVAVNTFGRQPSHLTGMISSSNRSRTIADRHHALFGLLAPAGTALLVGLAIMSVMPAWSMLVLPVVLGASELSLAWFVVALAWIDVVLWLSSARPASRILQMIALAIAAAIFLRPALQYRRTTVQAMDQLDALIRPLVVDFDFGMKETPHGGVPSAPHVREQMVRYAASDGRTPLAMRVFRGMTARKPSPIVIVIYGGAWRGGEPTQAANVSRALAESGYLVAAIDYRHAPTFTFPAQLDDVRRSIALVRDSAVSWNADVTRVALIGRSAGGHLAELAAFAPGDRPVQAVVAIYAPWNLDDGYRDPPVPDPIGVRGVIGNFIGGSPEQQPERYRAASPSSFVRPGLPSTLLVFGARDHLVKPEFNRAAAAALRRAGNRVVDVELPWAEHGFDLVPGGLGGRIAYASISRFLDIELRTRPAKIAP